MLKIVFMGPAEVGKTSIRKRYLGHGFSSTHNMTIGADISIKKIFYENEECLLQMWDLSGQPAFYEVRKLYYRGANGLFVVFDLSNLSTFKTIPKWIEEYKKHSFKSNTSVLLIGNKSDLLTDDGEKIRQEVVKQAKEMGIDDFSKSEIIFTSALTGENIEHAFNKLITDIMASRVTRELV